LIFGSADQMLHWCEFKPVSTRNATLDRGSTAMAMAMAMAIMASSMALILMHNQ